MSQKESYQCEQNYSKFVNEIDRIFSALSKSNFYADARIITGTSSLFSIEEGKITCVEGEITGIGVRTLCNGSFGYAWSTKISDFRNLLKKSERLAKISNGKNSLSEQKVICANVGKNYDFPQTEEKISLLKEAEKKTVSEKTRNATLVLRDSNIEKTFLSSEGSNIVQRTSYVYFSAVSIAKEGVQIQRGIERISSRKGYKNFDVVKTAGESMKSAERLLNACAPPKGRFPVIMNPEMTGVFSHEAVGHASEGDSIVERESVFANKLEKKLGSSKVTIIDDPNFEDFGQYFYDDDGIKAQSVKIIENGVLKSYLHSRQSAANIETDNQKSKTMSNGHARAQDHEFAPIVRMSNTLFAKGSESENSIFDVNEGIYVIGMKGGSVDIFSGDFMFAAKEAWLIKNSSKEKILRDITISGNILDVLAKVECVGKDFGTAPGFCGKMGQSVPVSDGGPHIRVSEMKVG